MMEEKEKDQLIKFNVGGVTFETKRKTLEFDKECKLSDDSFLGEFYLEDRNEIFFDRDPIMFSVVLNYLRTGELHLPSNICSAAARVELNYWGVQTEKVEMCCMSKYNEWNSALKAVLRLERDRKRKAATVAKIPKTGNTLTWMVVKQRTWQFLTRPQSSFAARVFGFASLIFAIFSIASFFAATTEPFQIVKYSNNSKVVPESVSDVAIGENKSHVINLNKSLELDLEIDNDEADVKIVTAHPLLHAIDIVCVVYFTVEYVTRLIVAPKRFKHATSVLGVIDFLALLPDYVEIVAFAINPVGHSMFIAFNYGTVLRVLRILRIFRLVRHSMGVWILIYTLRSSFRELMLLIWLLTICVMFFSSLIYFVEDRDNFKSIPDGFWWAIVTMTTVGYGDMYPVTIPGKLIGSLCAMCGVLVIGFTVPTLVNNFILFYSQMKAVEHFKKVSKEAKRNQKTAKREGYNNNNPESQTLVEDQ